MSLPVPSYVVSAFDEETLNLSKELEALGGGDAKIFNAEAHTVVVGPDDDDDGHDITNQTLWVKDNRIGFRNTSLSKTEPLAKSVKYFTFDSVSTINNVVDNPDRYQLVEDLKNHMLSGFNGTVIAVGEKGTGKTRTLFGASPPSITSDIVRIQDLPSSIVSSLLRLLYTHKNTSNELVTIALSVWAIRGSQLVDLLSPASSSESSMEFAVIECLDVKTAMQVISSARDKMPGVLCHPREPLQDCHKEPLHFFLRIILHTSAKCKSNNGIKNSVSADRPHANPFKTGTSNKTRSDSGRLSILTIVDLVGKLTDSDIAAPVSDDIRVLRRRTNLGLVALSRVMTLIKKAHKTSSDKSNENPVFPANTSITLTPARESTLTSVLTPMLVGNSKLFFMPFIRDGTKHSIGTYDTLALAQGINGILSATFRHTGVSLHDLKMKPPSHCLGPFIVNPFVAGHTHAVTNNNTAMDINATTTTNKDTLMTSKIFAKITNDNDHDNNNDTDNSFSTLLEQAQSVSVINKTIIDRINEINASTNAGTINASTSIDDNINTKINTNDDNDDITFSTSSKVDNIASLRTNNTTIYTITDINTESISYLSNFKKKSKHKTK